MFVMFFNVVFSMFVCYSAAFFQLCFYNKDWIDWIGPYDLSTENKSALFGANIWAYDAYLK